MDPSLKLTSSRVSANDYEEVFDYLYKSRMTDGLPVVPPTEDRVARMVAGSGRDPRELIGKIPPALGDATVEKIAVNAVMAGCLPEYMPVIIAAVEGMVEEAFDLYGLQTTTNPGTVGLIINGPIRKRLDVNCESGCMGPGWRANSTIGRAIRLILLNIGGATVPDVSKTTQAFPGRFSFCFGENEEESPWEPLHVERGFKPEQSCVTVIAPHGTLNMTFGDRLVATEGLPLMAATINDPATNHYSLFTGEPLIVFNPIHARELNAAGYGKRELKRYFWERCRWPVDKLSSLARERRLKKPHLIFDGMAPMVPSPEYYMIVVAGGHGGLHTTFVPSFGEPSAITKVIREP